MSITYPIAMPAMPPAPKQIQLIENFIVAANDSPFTAQRQTYEQQGSWWSAQLDFPPMTRAQAAPWLAFLGLLNGKSGTFLFGDPTVAASLGAAAGASVNGAGQTGKTLTLTGLTGTLKGGDYFQIGGENRLLYSQAFDNAVWTYNQITRPSPDTVVAPDSTTTAEALVPSSATNAFASQNLTGLAAGQSYTFSVWLKVPSGTKSINLSLMDALTGTRGNTSAITVTASWVRYSVTAVAAADNSWNVFIGGGGSNPAWTSGEIDAWGAQVEIGSIVGPDYLPTTSAAQASTRRLHLNLGDAVPGTAGAAVINIFPRLRESPIVGFNCGSLVFAKPQGQFRLDTNAPPYTVDNAGFYTLSFPIREAF